MVASINDSASSAFPSRSMRRMARPHTHVRRILIWNRYEVQLVEIIRAEYSTDPADWGYPENSKHLDDEVPF